MGTETLLARDLVPGALPTSTEVPAEHQVHHMGCSNAYRISYD
jgi:hypothetical protein